MNLLLNLKKTKLIEPPIEIKMDGVDIEKTEITKFIGVLSMKL